MTISPAAAGAWLGAVLLVLVLPVDQALQGAGASGLRTPHALATVAALAAVVAVASRMRVAFARTLLALALASAVFVRASYYGLVRFSGQGFTDEVFLHLSGEAFRVAWMEYSWLILGMVSLIVVATWAAFRVAPSLRKLRLRSAMILMGVGAAVLAWGAPALPEVQLAQSLHRWTAPRRLPLPDDVLERWRASGLVELDLRAKHEVTASAPVPARNLILLYIESGGAALVRHPRYPDLMPGMRTLMESASLVDEFHASAYITIEGLVNSLCGTLAPFVRDSEDMAGKDGLADWMPCLGDVLRSAGYTQSYMGGASLRFAGKGAFLAAHGYDKAMGIEEWRELGISERPDTWGLSDADLLARSHEEIARLRGLGKPFNLTLLTIGTHLPGFAYEECKPYAEGSERFLDAVSCTDQLISRWLRRLEDDGQLKDTLVVITADHHIFPSPDMKRIFGEEAVLDRRLPLVVVGEHGSVRARSGASYDLAPTILDLLGIQHDARFALGRSLLDPQPARTAFFRRYEDVVGGVAQYNPAGECPDPAVAEPVVLPLSPCDKRRLLDLLASQHSAFSMLRDALHCGDSVGVNRVRVPLHPHAGLEVVLNGSDQADRFTSMSRTVDAGTPGLYLLWLDPSGRVLERQHYAASAARSALPEVPRRKGARAFLAAWIGPSNDRELRPTWLPAFDLASAAWLTDATTGSILEKGVPVSQDHVELTLDPPECKALFRTAGLDAESVR